MIVDKSRGDLVFSATEGLSPQEVEGLSRESLEMEKLAWPAEPPQRFLRCLPLFSRERFIALLCAPAQELENFSKDDLAMLSGIATQLTVALENAGLYELTKKLSITDELTGLYNYRYLQEQIKNEVKRAERYKRNLSLIMLDIDNFKIYNDTYGHLEGDQVFG